MDCYHLLILASLFLSASAWSLPFQPMQRYPGHVIRYARPTRHIVPPMPYKSEESEWIRPKRERDDHEYDHEYDHDHDHNDHKSTSGVTGPVHTFVKTDKNANYKWGVRHHVGNKYAS